MKAPSGISKPAMHAVMKQIPHPAKNALTATFEHRIEDFRFLQKFLLNFKKTVKVSS